MIALTSLAASDHEEETRSLPNNRTRPITLERNERIESHLPLVTLVLAKVRRNLPAHVDADDLHSAGVTGLIAAAERFDPTRTVHLRDMPAFESVEPFLTNSAAPIRHHGGRAAGIVRFKRPFAKPNRISDVFPPTSN